MRSRLDEAASLDSELVGERTDEPRGTGEDRPAARLIAKRFGALGEDVRREIDHRHAQPLAVDGYADCRRHVGLQVHAGAGPAWDASVSSAHRRLENDAPIAQREHGVGHCRA